MLENHPKSLTYLSKYDNPPESMTFPYKFDIPIQVLHAFKSEIFRVNLIHCVSCNNCLRSLFLLLQGSPLESHLHLGFVKTDMLLPYFCATAENHMHLGDSRNV